MELVAGYPDLIFTSYLRGENVGTILEKAESSFHQMKSNYEPGRDLYLTDFGVVGKLEFCAFEWHQTLNIDPIHGHIMI